MRSRKAKKNALFSLAFNIVVAIASFILPKLIIAKFGSNHNGLLSAISQFIGYASLMHAGIGSVTRAALYNPLSKEDMVDVSGIVKATEIFMRKVALVFIFILVFFATVYPLFVSEEFEWFFTFTLVIIIGFQTFAQYFFGYTYQLLLRADQRDYITTAIQIVTTILSTILSVTLLYSGAEIHVIKLGSSLIFVLNPLLINVYVRKHYKIDKKAKPLNGAIKQRWDALGHQIANFTNNNVDIVILSFSTSVSEISVFMIYYLIANGLSLLIDALSVGVESAWGNMIANNEMTLLKDSLASFETLIFSLSLIFYICYALLVTPFVSLYTSGVTDANYYRPIFGYLIAASKFFYCVRIPYQSLVNAAGHFKQTRNMAFVEVILNIIVSVLLVKRFGLVGVTLGTLVAMIFRTVYYSLYVSKNIVSRSLSITLGKFSVCLISASVIIYVAYKSFYFKIHTYLSWLLNGAFLFTISIIITFTFLYIFYKKDLKKISTYVCKKQKTT